MNIIKNNKITLPIRMPKDEYKMLKEFAKKKGFSMNIVVRIAVQKFIREQNIKEIKEKLAA